ncbi:exo-alpha-sialidase [Actinomadura sp. 9N215]|uniref:exo-alpha-sialidase n=1 Tax=Actinomadura sp. 9N215 TaxID=3375150 RepID=UPI0037AAE957
MRRTRTTRSGVIRALSVVAAGTVAGMMISVPSAAAETKDPAKDRKQYHIVDVIFRGNYVEGLNGIKYDSFRIPAIVRTNAGTLLAFAEGRAKSKKDYGNINLVYKRGTNNGATHDDWSGLKEAVGAGMGTWGNPTPVVDRSTGTIWLFMSWNAADKSQSGGTNPDTGEETSKVSAWGERRVFVMKSTDDGQTFTGMNGEPKPTDMTDELLPNKQPDGKKWTWDAIGPGAGLYTKNGTLVIPAQHRNIYSTDHGKTWKVVLMSDAKTSEATVTQLPNGELYRNDRPTRTTWETDDGDGIKHKRRWVSRTPDITKRFPPSAPDDKLLDPRNQGSALLYNDTEPDAPPRTLFLNSASTESRTKMRVRVSYDKDARTWERSRPLSEGPEWPPVDIGEEGGYSSMTKTADEMVGALIEAELSTTETFSILYRKFNIPWVVNGCTC